MNSPKKSSKEDLFCDFAVGTYTFAVVAAADGKNSTPVFTEEYNSETCSTSFASMSSTGTYSGTTWQSSSKKCCSSSSTEVLLMLLLLLFVFVLLLLLCAMFFRCLFKVVWFLKREKIGIGQFLLLLKAPPPSSFFLQNSFFSFLDRSLLQKTISLLVCIPSIPLCFEESELQPRKGKKNSNKRKGDKTFSHVI